MKSADVDDIADALAHPDGQRERRVVHAIAEIAGVSHRVARAMHDAIGGMGGLFAVDESSLIAHGLNESGAHRVMHAVQLAREYRTFHSRGERRTISHPESIWTLALSWGWTEEEQEVFRVVSLSSMKLMRGVDVVAVGSVDRVDVHPREVFRVGIRRNASAIVLVHNHPSGDPMPSESDLALTRRMIEVGKVVGIAVLDHVVVGRNGWRSIALDGTIPGFGDECDEDN